MSNGADLKRRHNLRKRLMKVQGGLCAYCGRVTRYATNGGDPGPLAATIDEVVPVALGGRQVWSNSLVACLLCNQAKGCRPPTGCELIFRDFVRTVYQARFPLEAQNG